MTWASPTEQPRGKTSPEELAAAQVPRLDDSGFQAAVAEASEPCPASQLFARAKVSVDAVIEPAP